VANALLSSMSRETSGGGGGYRIQPEGTLIAAPLTSGGHPNSNAPGRRKEDDENLVIAGPLGGGNDGNDGIGRRSEDDPNLAVNGASVRRLTPTECERLQAFPDGWTNLSGTPDSRRYAALGDAVTVNVAEWIGRRIIAA
jgi:site-specific DNA-cytosine methylase